MTRISGLRTSLLPVEHLEAELIAAPLASRAAFEQGLVALDGGLGSSTGALWRETEGKLLSRFPGMSIDELVNRRDQLWFDGIPSTAASKTLLSYLRAVSRSMLEPGEGPPQIGRPVGGAPLDHLRRGLTDAPLEQRGRWRWMTLALPQDLLLAAIDAPGDHVDFLAPLLRQSLADRGVAETHLHLKAAIDFPMLWASLQKALGDETASEQMLESPGAEFDEGRQLGPWLLRCALARLVLGAFLSNASGSTRFLDSFLRSRVFPGAQRLGGVTAEVMLRRVLEELELGRFLDPSPPFWPLRRLYASLAGSMGGSDGRRASHGLDQVDQLDPLGWWFPGGAHLTPERRFLRAAMRYLEDPDGRKDITFARLFWQVERLRVVFYRHIVQRPMTPGLIWFARTYARLSSARKPLSLSTFVHSALHSSAFCLRSLEVRLVPEPSMTELASTIEEIDAACSRAPDIEVGVVFHFSRTRGPDAERGRPKPWGLSSHDDPGSTKHNPSGYRFAGYYTRVRAEALALADLLCTYPRMLERVRGIDLCTDELGVPLWVLKPLVEHVRNAGLKAARILGTFSAPVRPLQLTIHAGEDFVHLLGGVRRVAEALEYLGLAEGDRIGHGVALGVDAAAWAARATGLLVQRGERLFDLLWIWRLAMSCDNAVLRSWLSWVSQEVSRLASEIFGESYDPIELNQWVEHLHNGLRLFLAGFPNGPAPGAHSRTARLMNHWLRNRAVFQNAQVLERIDPVCEVDLVTETQAHVLSMLARRGVVIEINPSSNLLIGHLGDLANHPLWRICPPVAGSRHQQVRVCIGSDDPITFATRLADEYQLLADAMLEGGLMPQEVDDWIERARQAGLDSRFTVSRSAGRPLRSLIAFDLSPLLP